MSPSGRAILALAVLLSAAPALAQSQPGQPDFAAAKQHYQAAEEASAKGDHATAAREYGIAYDITKDPVLFFKIGQSYERAGDCTSANVYYGRYLKEGNPSEEFKQKTEAAMKGCGQAKPPEQPENRTQETGNRTQETGDGTAAAPVADREAVGSVTAPKSLEDEEPSWQRTAAWSSVGIAVALLTTGAVLGLSAASREEDVDNLIEFRDAEGQPAIYTGATRERYRDLISEGDRLESLAVVAFAASGVAVASAALFFVLDARAADRADEGSALRPTAGPDGVGLSWGGRF